MPLINHIYRNSREFQSAVQKARQDSEVQKAQTEYRRNMMTAMKKENEKVAAWEEDLQQVQRRLQQAMRKNMPQQSNPRPRQEQK